MTPRPNDNDAALRASGGKMPSPRTTLENPCAYAPGYGSEEPELFPEQYELHAERCEGAAAPFSAEEQEAMKPGAEARPSSWSQGFLLNPV